MKLAVMQPYLFPYLGYFQLVHAVDTFVVYDDVNYIKGGWINRNYILAQDGKQLVTLPLQGASPNKQINRVMVSERRRKVLETIRQRYLKAPNFADVYPLIEDVLSQKEDNLAAFLDYQLRQICDYLGIHATWHVSSSLSKSNELRGQEKVLEICEALGADHYVNAAGGRSLYDKQAFVSRGVRLLFMQMHNVTYSQFGNEFVPNLSIVDVMMFNDKSQCAQLLEEYELV